MGNKCFHAPNYACSINATLPTPYNNCTGWGIMCEAQVPSVYQVFPGQWKYNYQCTDQPKRMITAAIVFLAVSGGVLLFQCLFCRALRGCASSSKFLYLLEAILAVCFPIGFLGGFTLLAIGYTPYNMGQKLEDLGDICSISANSKTCRAFVCHYSHSGQAGIIVGIIIGFSIIGCFYSVIVTPKPSHRWSRRPQQQQQQQPETQPSTMEMLERPWNVTESNDEKNQSTYPPPHQQPYQPSNLPPAYLPPSSSSYPPPTATGSTAFPPPLPLPSDDDASMYPPRVEEAAQYPPLNFEDAPPPAYPGRSHDSTA